MTTRKRKVPVIKIVESDSDNEEYSYKPGTVPEFVTRLLRNGYVSQLGKTQFYDNIALPYMTNDQTRNYLHGKFALFDEDELIGVFNSRKDMDAIIDKKNKINKQKNIHVVFYSAYIGDDQTPVNRFHHSSFIGTKLNKSENYFNPHKIILKLYSISGDLEQDYYIDSGSSQTSLMLSMYWTFCDEIIKKPYYDVNLTTDKRIKKILNELNSKIKRIENMYIRGCDGIKIPYNMVIFDPPVNVGINTLTPILLETFVVPEQKPMKKIPNLIGLDVISLHTLIYGKFSGELGLKILPECNIDSAEDLYDLVNSTNS